MDGCWISNSYSSGSVDDDIEVGIDIRFIVLVVAPNFSLASRVCAGITLG